MSDLKSIQFPHGVTRLSSELKHVFLLRPSGGSHVQGIIVERFHPCLPNVSLLAGSHLRIP